MIKIALLGSNAEDKITTSLLEDIITLGVNCEFVHVNNPHRLSDADVVYVTKHSLKLDYNNLAKKTKLINSYSSMINSKSKIKTTKILANDKISQPNFIIAKNYSEILEFTSQNGQTILKSPYSCAGKGHIILTYDNKKLIANTKQGTFEIKDYSDHLMFENNYYMFPCLIQKFISNKDTNTNDIVYRVYIIGQDAKFGTLRKKENVKKNIDSIINIAQGAHYEFIGSLDNELKDLAIKTANAVGFDIGVVDLLKDKQDKYYVLECDCDGKFFMIDRKFMELQDYGLQYNFNRMIGKRLIEITEGSEYRK
jgi:glutathione synthase/RimK-type ligase-like ATP-grasp enzyme